MSERACIRGCTVSGQHYAQCPDYGRSDGTCLGCAPADALDGALICRRCANRLRQRLEQAPDLIEHIRTRSHSVSVMRPDHVRAGTDGSTHAPIQPEILDAQRDIMATICAGALPADASPGEAKLQAIGGVGHVLAHFDDLVNDAESIAEWWAVVIAHEVPGSPDFWTISRALARWPLEDRKHWARMPCPACDLRTVKVTPARRPGARTWYTCATCDWERNDADDGGLWDDRVTKAGLAAEIARAELAGELRQ